MTQNGTPNLLSNTFFAKVDVKTEEYPVLLTEAPLSQKAYHFWNFQHPGNVCCYPSCISLCFRKNYRIVLDYMEMEFLISSQFMKDKHFLRQS
jgi:hypothetical protein